METDRLAASQLQVQIVPAQSAAPAPLAQAELAEPQTSQLADDPPFQKKCIISNLVRRPPVNIEFDNLKFTTHNAKGGECPKTAYGLPGTLLGGRPDGAAVLHHQAATAVYLGIPAASADADRRKATRCR